MFIIEEILNSFCFILFIIQNIFLYYNDCQLLTKNIVQYKINDKTKDMIVYKNSPNKSKKYVYFLCGGFVPTTTTYINKITYDLITLYPNLIDEYNLIVLEKEDQCYLSLYDDLSKFIEQTTPSDIEEIIFIGISGGGVVASHILQRLKHIDCYKKLLMYDSAYSVIDNVLHYNSYIFYRVDYFMYFLVKDAFFNHYNYYDIKHKIIDEYPYFNGCNEYINMVKSILQYNDDMLYRESCFNFDQTEKTKVINVSSKNDHIIFPHLNKIFVEKNKHKFNCSISNIVKDTYGHCSDMAFSTDYIKYILYVLE